jgi:hypothetical protein
MSAKDSLVIDRGSAEARLTPVGDGTFSLTVTERDRAIPGLATVVLRPKDLYRLSGYAANWLTREGVKA